MIRSTTGKHFFALQAQLGEGPVWDYGHGCLWCVDIVACTIHRINFRTENHTFWQTPSKIGWIYPTGPGQFLVGLAKGIYQFWPDEGRYELVQPVEAEFPDNRINDGTIGPDGTVWFGTMDDHEAAATGRFYRFNGSALSDCGLPAIPITNGPAVSPDGRLLYTVDTLAREIWVHSISVSGHIESSSIFAVTAQDRGFPDGITCDSEGGLWVGYWGGWMARRYDPSSHITDEVSFPVPNITKIALGGPGGLIGFATTARKGVESDILTKHPSSGDIFTFNLRVPAMLQMG